VLFAFHDEKHLCVSLLRGRAPDSEPRTSVSGSKESEEYHKRSLSHFAQDLKTGHVTVGYLAPAAESFRPRAAPSDKRPTRPIIGKELPVVGNVLGKSA